MKNSNLIDMATCLEEIRKNPEPDKLRDLAAELNIFFRDSKCKGVLYTKNADDLFFGVYVMPAIDPANIYGIILDDKYVRIDEYYVELDSKLFDLTANLSSEQILALMLHDIASMIGSSSPVELAVKEIDVYLDRVNSYIRPTDNINYANILTFGFKDLLHKITSIFCNIRDDEYAIPNDVFANHYSLTGSITSAMSQLRQCGHLTYFNHGVSKATVIAWVLRLYDNVRNLRIQIAKGFRKALDFTSVRLVKNEINRLITSMNRIDDSAMLESTSFFKKFLNSTSRSFFRNINDYEGDYYNYKVQLRATMDEDDVLLLLHQINTKISVIEGFLELEDITENERDRAIKLREKFFELREQLSKTQVYRNNYRRIYINYPD